MALRGVPVLGAYVPQAEAAIRAATGQGQGSNFSERYQNILPQRQELYRQAQERVPLPEYAIALGDLYTRLGRTTAAKQKQDLVARLV